MTMMPFRGRCHTCGHDHDAEAELVRDVLDLCKQATNAEAHEKPLLQWSSQAVLDVAAERRRKIEVDGWTPEHDDEHDPGEIAAAGSAYALAAADVLHPLSQGDGDFKTTPPTMWPWDREWWKPGEPRRMLVKAAALLLAEIERLDRATEGP